MILGIIIGVIVGIFVDSILFKIWHFYAHSKQEQYKEEIQKRKEGEVWKHKEDFLDKQQLKRMREKI